ncbi:hypothetical protein BD289DRAFT_156241 [Coniella lustricola]|uniref:Uncharacterized protein n=1 Tax=Coniella lustricola TaxID=2025994 RepID=A0A2T3AMI1_9PEZI|nr:hypothetical protein BD289DRAFT_156241 [Coniella lustricola]
MIQSAEDTQYFDEDQPMSDLSDTDDEQEDQQEALAPPFFSSETVASQNRSGGKITRAPNGFEQQLPLASTSYTRSHPRPKSSIHACFTGAYAQGFVAAQTSVIRTSPSPPRITEREVRLAAALGIFEQDVQQAVRSWLTVPYDSHRLRNFELQVDAEPGLQRWERDALKAVVRAYGRKEKKRPRDRLLRDPTTRKIVLAERMKTAFMGYDWRRVETIPTSAMLRVLATGQICCANGLQTDHAQRSSAFNPPLRP